MAMKPSLFKSLKDVLEGVAADRKRAVRNYNDANKALTWRTVHDDNEALYRNYNEAYKEAIDKDRVFRETFAPYLADDDEWQKYVENTLSDKKFARSVGVPRGRMDYWGVSDAFAKNMKDEPEYLQHLYDRNPYHTGGLESESPIIRDYAKKHVHTVEKP